MFNLLHSNTVQQLFEKTSAVTENYGYRTEENFGDFGKSIVIRQSFFRQSFWLLIGPLRESRSALVFVGFLSGNISNVLQSAGYYVWSY